METMDDWHSCISSYVARGQESQRGKEISDSGEESESEHFSLAVACSDISFSNVFDISSASTLTSSSDDEIDINQKDNNNHRKEKVEKEEEHSKDYIIPSDSTLIFSSDGEFDINQKDNNQRKEKEEEHSKDYIITSDSTLIFSSDGEFDINRKDNNTRKKKVNKKKKSSNSCIICSNSTLTISSDEEFDVKQKDNKRGKKKVNTKQEHCRNYIFSVYKPERRNSGGISKIIRVVPIKRRLPFWKGNENNDLDLEDFEEYINKRLKIEKEMEKKSRNKPRPVSIANYILDKGKFFYIVNYDDKSFRILPYSECEKDDYLVELLFKYHHNMQ
uniref:Protein kinase domain-containing protein n=1 Tax=Parastrongyloides trichosuri TaxID=131310 RepID=A0A0N4ZVT3_PARTI